MAKPRPNIAPPPPDIEQEVPEREPEPVVNEKKTKIVFTYVGGGEDSPRVINFMGRQRFVRGQPTEVTDQELLSKIRGCPTFVEGTVDEEELHDYDIKAKAEADDQRKADNKMQRLVEKAKARWASKGDE